MRAESDGQRKRLAGDEGEAETQASASPREGRGNGAQRRPPGEKTKANFAAGLREQVTLSAAIDERLALWQRQGRIGFFLPAGEWASLLVACATASGELIFPGLREARVALFRGYPLVDYLRQHLGLLGPAIPGAIASAAHRVASPGGNPGAHLPQAVGAAMAARARSGETGRKEAVLALAGGAAADTGDCHVALNFASVFKAPVVFVFRTGPGCEPGTLVKRAAGYALPAERLSGEDPVELRQKLALHLSNARDGQGPAVLEVTAPETVAVVTEEALAACDAALEKALAITALAPDGLTQNVYAEPTWPLVEQAAMLAGHAPIPEEEI